MNSSRDANPHQRALGSVSLCMVLSLVLQLASRLEAQQDRTFVEENRITAIDLVLGFEADTLRDWATDSPIPKDLRGEDFEILYDGRPRPVVAVETTTGPWEIVIFFDAALTSSAGLRWAATALADRSSELTDLGEVTIVVADPAPWTMLAPTRDRDQLKGALSQLARFQEGSDELVTLRGQVIEQWDDPDVERELDGQDLRTAVVTEEARIIRARHDDLLLELTERMTDGPFRLLLLASGGYDLNPQEFYQSLAEIPTSGEPTLEPSGGTNSIQALATATETLARTLAAYGWVVMPLLSPEEDPLKRGLRIGKLRLTGPRIGNKKHRATPTDWEDYDQTVVWLFGAKLEGHRKPKRAEAYLELGSALQGQGKLPEAEDALRQALHHFAGDPKTAERQAVAFARLGSVLAAQEQPQEANAAWLLARRLNPEVEIVGRGPIAALIEPGAPLFDLARTTAGRLVLSDKGLAGALTSLRERVRLTYQVAGQPDGNLHTLQARFKTSRGLIYPGWARSSIPESVSAARVRRLLSGEPTGGRLKMGAEFFPRGGDHGGELHIELEPPAQEPVEALESANSESKSALRLTLGVGGPDVEPTIEHRRIGSQSGRGIWSYRVGFEIPEDRSWLAVLIEDLESGSWGGRLIEVP